MKKILFSLLIFAVVCLIGLPKALAMPPPPASHLWLFGLCTRTVPTLTTDSPQTVSETQPAPFTVTLTNNNACPSTFDLNWVGNLPTGLTSSNLPTTSGLILPNGSQTFNLIIQTSSVDTDTPYQFDIKATDQNDSSILATTTLNLTVTNGPTPPSCNNDGTCNGSENCTSCPSDCLCPVPQAGTLQVIVSWKDENGQSHQVDLSTILKK